MTERSLHTRILTVILLGILAALAHPFPSDAQEGIDVLVSWSAASYVPPHYEGKSLPALLAPISVSFELLEGGRLVNLAGENVLWYLDNRLIESGRGLKTITITSGAFPGTVQRLRIQINDFRAGGGVLAKTIAIPTAGPKAVVEAPYPGGAFSGTRLAVLGFPYFFNVRERSALDARWLVNGAAPASSGNPWELAINVADAQAGNTLKIDLIVTSPQSDVERASDSRILSFTQ